MRSFALILLRRLLFRSLPQGDPTTTITSTAAAANNNSRLTLYDHLSAQSLATLERILLHSLLHEPSQAVRRKAVDTVTDLANNAMSRGRPWPALQAQTFAMADSEDAVTREAAYRVFAGTTNLIMDLQRDSVLAMLQKGLQDPQSIEATCRFTVSRPRCSIRPRCASPCSTRPSCISPSRTSRSRCRSSRCST